MDKEQLLYHYFSDGLNPEQEQHFYELLEKDSEFKEQFSFEQDLQVAIRNKESKNLKLTLKDFEANIQNRSQKKPKSVYQNWTIAASVILLLGLGWLGYYNLFTNDYSDMFVDNFETYPNTVVAITRGDTIQSLERHAFAAYESGNFQTALDNFEKIPQGYQKPYVDFYLAQCYLKLNKLEEAKIILNRNIKNGTTFIPESHWYLALIYLKEKDKENAILQLQKLTSLYNYKTEKVNALLGELK